MFAAAVFLNGCFCDLQELQSATAAYTEASQSNDDLQAETKQLRRQLKNSMALVDKLQHELESVTDAEAEKYAGDKAERKAAYFELESTLHKTRSEKTKLVRENKQLQRKVEKFESANSGAAAQGMLTDGGWCVCLSAVFFFQVDDRCHFVLRKEV